jgi:hypothetical protein
VNTKSKIVIAAVAGAALGATAMQGLHAQAKLKAYSIGEIEGSAHCHPTISRQFAKRLRRPMVAHYAQRTEGSSP